MKCPKCGYDLDNLPQSRTSLLKSGEALREREISLNINTPQAPVQDNLRKDAKEKDRKEIEDIFNLLMEGKKKEIEQRYGRRK